METIFITGGTGFIGAYIIKELVEKGYAVRAIRHSKEAPFFMPAHISNKVEWVPGDVLDVVSLDEAMTISAERDPDLLALDEALKSLAEIDERKSRIVELRYFGGLSVEETAEVMKLSFITITREWNKAKAWLYRELSSN